MSAPPNFVFDVRNAGTQELLVEVAGEDVLNITGRGGDPDDDMQMPDWVEAFARAVNLGFFGGAAHAPWDSRARVVENTFDRAARHNRWRVQVENVDPGALRVLATSLRARELDRVTLATIDAPSGARYAALDGLALPGRYHALPFPVEDEEVVKHSKDRGIEIELAEPPDDATDERAMAALGLWVELLLLGAYAEADRDPRRSGAFPDGACWIDEVTVTETFSEAFAADDRAFDAMVNWAARLHHDGVAVRAVRVR